MGAGVFSEDRRGNAPKIYGAFGSSTCLVAKGHRLTIVLALEEETDYNISKGQPPRSHIKIQINNSLKFKTSITDWCFT